MSARDPRRHRLVVVVGAGGVGKTTIAAALGVNAAREGRRTLVMTFDPSRRLKDALGVGEEAAQRPVRVALEAPGSLEASLLDARLTFDRLIERYAPDEEAARRILNNRFYHHLAGSLAGILEYMAVERLYEVARDERYERIVLDTPPTAQALDFLEAPDRITGFLDSGAVRLATRSWFDEHGHLRPTTRLGYLGRRFERLLDDVVGLELLRDMIEFFQAFDPLYAGFRGRAGQVRDLMRSPDTLFVLVAGPGRERIAETMFFARKLEEAGYRLGPLVVNRIHPAPDDAAAASAARPDLRDGAGLMRWLGRRDRRGLDELGTLLGPGRRPAGLPLMPRPPVDLAGLEALRRELVRRL